MSDSLAALIPVFALIALGAGLKRAGFAPEAFWAGADRLTYYVFFPALLLHSLATTNIADLAVGDAVFASVLCVLAATGLTFTARRLLRLDGPAFTSVLQGSIRPNTYVALAVAVAIYDEAGLSAVAIGVIAFIPLVNLISVAALAVWGKSAKTGAGVARAIFVQVVTNPLIIACALGILANVYGVDLPPPAEETLRLLGAAALPLGLVAVGAGLRFGALKRTGVGVIAASLVKLAILPAFLVFAMNNLELTGAVAGAVLLFGAAPASISSYILSRQMGGDDALMAAIITAETLIAVATLPLWLWAKDWFI